MNTAKSGGTQAQSDEAVVKFWNWRSRMIVSTILLLLSLIGVIITCADRTSSFSRWYWTGAVVAFAVLCLWLNRIDLPAPRRVKGLAVWHAVLHWGALLVIILHVHLLVYAGIADNITAGLVILMLLALTTFLAGIYYDSTFILLGILLFILGIVATLLYQYILPVAVVAVIAVAVVIFFLYRKKKSSHSAA